jgi:prevent-host-death family protein
LTSFVRKLYGLKQRTGEFTSSSIVVSARQARSEFGKLLSRVESERRSLVIQKRGVARAVLVSIPDYVRLAAPEPEVLRIIGDESVRKGASTLNAQRINQIIRATRKKNH